MLRRSLPLVLAVAAATLAPGLDPRAEVGVRRDRAGRYVAVEMHTVGRRGEPVVWAARGRVAAGPDVLNPRGDFHGDLWPVIVESNHGGGGGGLPWVVWSRFNGTEYDLAWSRWSPQGWRPVEPVLAEPLAGDDLDPDLAFDPMGHAYLVWTRRHGGIAEVRLSVWLKRHWMHPVVVSEPGVDSRYPVILGFEDGAVQVEFTTPGGVTVQRVAPTSPGTITDDINPVLPRARMPGSPTCPDGDVPVWEER